ncbi:acyltransferase [Prevotella sp.]
MKQILKNYIKYIGKLYSYVYPNKINKCINTLKNNLYTGYIQKNFAHFGNSVIMWKPYTLLGAQNIYIGNNVVIESGVQLVTYSTKDYKPEIHISDNTLIRRNSHITAINKIRIGKNVLTGTNVLISDNEHGESSRQNMNIQPRLRQLVSKGEVIIEDNVWIGNNACILGGVRIGMGSIIGANAVVTKDIPPYSIAAGVPAKIISHN